MASDYSHPVTTIFVTNIDENTSQELPRDLLKKCGPIANWRRVHEYNATLDEVMQPFGYCDFLQPEAAWRAFRLLNGFQLGTKKLLVILENADKLLILSHLNKARQAAGKPPLDLDGELPAPDPQTLAEDQFVKQQLWQVVEAHRRAPPLKPKKPATLKGTESQKVPLPYKCHACNLRFGSERRLDLHVRKRRCNELKARFIAKSMGVPNPEDSVAGSSAKSSSLSKKERLIQQQVDASAAKASQGRLLRQCSECLAVFPSYAKLTAHQRANNHFPPPYSIKEEVSEEAVDSKLCPVCQTRFSSFAELRDHRSGRGHACSLVPSSLETQNDTDDDPKQCPVCKVRYPTFKKLRAHQGAKGHRPEPETTSHEEQDTEGTKHCGVCRARFPTFAELRLHRMVKGPCSLAVAAEEDATHDAKQCPICRIRFSSFTELRSHRGVVGNRCSLVATSHEAPKDADDSKQCPVCEVSFASFALLRDHQTIRNHFLPSSAETANVRRTSGDTHLSRYGHDYRAISTSADKRSSATRDRRTGSPVRRSAARSDSRSRDQERQYWAQHSRASPRQRSPRRRSSSRSRERQQHQRSPVAHHQYSDWSASGHRSANRKSRSRSRDSRGNYAPSHVPHYRRSPMEPEYLRQPASPGRRSRSPRQRTANRKSRSTSRDARHRHSPLADSRRHSSRRSPQHSRDGKRREDRESSHRRHAGKESTHTKHSSSRGDIPSFSEFPGFSQGFLDSGTLGTSSSLRNADYQQSQTSEAMLANLLGGGQDDRSPLDKYLAYMEYFKSLSQQQDTQLPSSGLEQPFLGQSTSASASSSVLDNFTGINSLLAPGQTFGATKGQLDPIEEMLLNLLLEQRERKKRQAELITMLQAVLAQCDGPQIESYSGANNGSLGERMLAALNAPLDPS